jgi:hypothetical protein
LHLAAPAFIPYEDIQLAIFAEGNDTTIVVASCRLSLITLIRRDRTAVTLEGTQFDQIMIVGKTHPVPKETIHPVAEQGYGQDII